MRLFATIGITMACGLFAVVAAAQPNGAVERAQPFERLTGPRIDVAADADGVAPLTDFCPDETERCQRYWAYTLHFVRSPGIPVRDREIVILRTAWLSRGDYIWGRHNVIGQDAGLTEEEIRRIRVGPDAPGLTDFDRALIRAVDELHASRFISGTTWEALAGRYDEAQLVEVVQTVGNYIQLAMFQNTLGVLLPPDVAGLPDESSAR